MGKPWENGDVMGKTMGKPWENGDFMGKTIGKPWEKGDFMGKTREDHGKSRKKERETGKMGKDRKIH